MILVRIGEIDQHFTESEIAEFFGSDREFEWHELVPDPRAEEDFERIYQQDLLRKLLEHAKLSRREREVIELYLKGEALVTAARKNGLHRHTFWNVFRCAVMKLRKAAAELGELSQLPQECPPTQKQVYAGFRSECNR